MPGGRCHQPASLTRDSKQTYCTMESSRLSAFCGFNCQQLHRQPGHASFKVTWASDCDARAMLAGEAHLKSGLQAATATPASGSSPDYLVLRLQGSFTPHSFVSNDHLLPTINGTTASSDFRVRGLALRHCSLAALKQACISRHQSMSDTQGSVLKATTLRGLRSVM
jgi:hypothetical protein